jgi:hypothetical protein
VLVDANAVFANESGAVTAYPLDGGAPVPLTSTGFGFGDWAQDADALYLAIPVESGPVVRVSKAGGMTNLLISIRPDQIAVDATAIYYTELPNGGTPRLMRLPK